VFISAHADFDSGVRALKGGALDFLRKPVTDRDLLEAISRALDRDRSHRTERSAREDLQARERTLTPREREVFALVTAGYANKRVGADLGAAEATIKLHRARVMQKMKAESLADLVRMADKLGLRGQDTPGSSGNP
jgi:FixJ family two-component response regulator